MLAVNSHSNWSLKGNRERLGRARSPGSRRLDVGPPRGWTTRGALLAIAVAVLLVPYPAPAKVRVSGVVVDETGEPIEGAVVRMQTVALDTSITAKGVSNGKGKFQMIMAHPAGSYFFRVEAEGYERHEELVEIGLQRTELTAPIRKTFELRAAKSGTVATTSPAAEVYTEGVDAFQVEDWEAARGRFREATELDPDLIQAWIGLARVAYTLGDFRGALDAIARFGDADAPTEVLEVREDAFLALGERDAAKAVSRELKRRRKEAAN